MKMDKEGMIAIGLLVTIIVAVAVVLVIFALRGPFKDLLGKVISGISNKFIDALSNIF